MFVLIAIFVLVMAAPASAATIQVTAGGDLQAALNAAQPGDEVVLQAGATFTGAFVLPPKPAGAAIRLRSSATLPDRRVGPADAGLMPTLVSGSVESALTAAGVANWIVAGVRFLPNVNGEGNVISLQDATNIQLDRVLLVVPADRQQKRGIMGNGRQISVTRSYIAGVWRSGQDSQAFCAWDGAGPYTLRDNYFEAASENVMFGGANSRSADRVPADILVEGNHFSKPLAWKGQPRVVKNLFELKSAKRVVVRNNLFERNWTDAQNGYAILFTVRNDEGGSPWSVIEDVLFERNVVRDTESGINVLGYDSYQASGRTTRVTIRHNLVLASGTFLQVGSEVGELTLDHNTVSQTGTFGILYKGAVWVAGTSAARHAQYAVEKLTITNTLANHGPYGLFGEDTGIGTPALNGLTRTYSWTHNVLAGDSGWGQTYPSITWQPAMAEHLANFNPDYTLVSGSAYRNAGTDGQNLGATLTTLSAPPPPPPPPPPTEVCGDGKDNDNDGQIDEGCPVEICGDKIDNDNDGLVDEGCPPPTEVCGDKIDNDNDGQIDEGCTVTPTDTTGPSITLWNVAQQKNQLRFRVNAADPSGIASVVVEFRGSVVASGTSVPMNVTIPLQKVPPGVYEVRVTVTDRVGNASVKSHTFTR